MAETTAAWPLNSTVSRSPKLADLQTIQVAIQDAINRRGYRELRRVDLECNGDTVTISGRLPTYYLKQLVQHIALAAPGVRRVNNEVDVG